MQLDDLLNLTKEQLRELIFDYKDKDIVYRIVNNFEDYISEYEKCEMCGNWEHTDNMIDTEGKINGGIGRICLSCKEDI